jgi:hypothetical protein
MSPESIVRTGFRVPSKNPRCTVDGDAFSSCVFGEVCADAIEGNQPSTAQTAMSRCFMMCPQVAAPIYQSANLPIRSHTYRASWKNAVDELLVTDNRNTVDDDVANANRRQTRFSIRRSIDHARGVENRDVGVGSHA